MEVAANPVSCINDNGKITQCVAALGRVIPSAKLILDSNYKQLNNPYASNGNFTLQLDQKYNGVYSIEIKSAIVDFAPFTMAPIPQCFYLHLSLGDGSNRIFGQMHVGANMNTALTSYPATQAFARFAIEPPSLVTPTAAFRQVYEFYNHASAIVHLPTPIAGLQTLHVRLLDQFGNVLIPNAINIELEICGLNS